MTFVPFQSQVLYYHNIANGYLNVALYKAANLFDGYFTVLPNHIHEIFWWIIFFFFTSAIVRLSIAPRLIAFAELRGAKVGDNARKKWGHTIVSFINSIVCTVLGLYLYFDNKSSIGSSVEERVFGYDPQIGSLFAFVLAYFVWDLIICVRNVSSYGRGFLMHAVLGFMASLVCFRPNLQYITCRFLLFDMSTIFINIHWFLEKLGCKRNAWYVILNDVIGLAVYCTVRLVFGSYLSFQCLQDIYKTYPRIHSFCLLIALAGNVVTHMLNFYWFFKLARSGIRACLAPGEARKEKIGKKTN